MIFYFIASIHLKTFLIALLLYKTLPKIKKKIQKIKYIANKSSPTSQTYTYYVYFFRTRFRGYEL